MNTETALARLSAIVGEGNCSQDAATLERYAIDGRQPGAVVRPGTAEEVTEVVRFAAADKLALTACGSGSKLGIGMPPAAYDVAVNMTRLNRIAAYDPGDLTLGVEAGMGVASLLESLAEKSQWVPILVPWFERATVGGILSANSMSPLRYMFGGPRDFLLGMEFVTGDGKLCKSGARVVKSVAGYDIHKVLLGAVGTLGIITRVNFRTFPLPRAQRCFVASYADAKAALEFCRRIAESPLKPALLEVLDPTAAGFPANEKLPAGSWCAVAAAIGHEAVVERHARDLSQLAQQTRAASFEALEDSDKRKLLGSVREFLRTVSEQLPGAAVLRMPLVPQQIPAACETIARLAAGKGLQCALLLRAGNTLYATLWSEGGTGAPELESVIRTVMDPAGGLPRAVVEQCPAAVKARLNTWGPVREDFALMKRIKQVFDPHGILSPGRFVGGL